MGEPWEAIELAQKEVELRRALAEEVRRNARDIAHVRELLPDKPPWYLPIILTVGLTVLGGYIGLVHNLALGNRARIELIADEQNRRSSLKADVDDIKKRLATNEALAAQIPFINQQLHDISTKLDRLIERRP